MVPTFLGYRLGLRFSNARREEKHIGKHNPPNTTSHLLVVLQLQAAPRRENIAIARLSPLYFNRPLNMKFSYMIFVSVVVVSILSASARSEPLSSIGMRTAAPTFSRRSLSSKGQASRNALSFLDNESSSDQQVTQCSVRAIHLCCAIQLFQTLTTITHHRVERVSL